MIPLVLPGPPDRPLRVLCLGAHSDDIEIGAGGTILRLLRERPGSVVDWVVFSGEGRRAEEAEASAGRFLEAAGDRRVIVHGFADGFFPFRGAEIKKTFEAMKEWPAPDVIFTHDAQDRHQDHRLVWELTWNTFRDHLILQYEIPKYDGDLTTPNLYVPLDSATAQRKASTLMEVFESQRDRHWFDEETFLGLMRLRGVESASPAGYAEGFHVRKAVLDLGEP